MAEPEEGGYVAFFADFDRDGAIDLFVSSMCYYEQFVESQVAGRAVGRNRAHLYRNLGGDRFADVAPEAGISRNFGTMGAGIGDVDYDGLVDLYLANGGPVMPRFEPNILYHNRGERFADVTESAGVGNLGKGHGATFADYDGDGDLDLYAAIGGHYPGDLWPNSLYRNDGRGSHWLAVELEGTRSNRSAVGAQVTVHAGGRQLDRRGGQRRRLRHHQQPAAGVRTGSFERGLPARGALALRSDDPYRQSGNRRHNQHPRG